MSAKQLLKIGLIIVSLIVGLFLYALFTTMIYDDSSTWSLGKMFSDENITETSIVLGVSLAIVLVREVFLG